LRETAIETLLTVHLNGRCGSVHHHACPWGVGLPCGRKTITSFCNEQWI
jgi:hypothetical protein